MIKKTLLLALVMFVLYSVLTMWRGNKINYGQNIAQRNLILAQNFMLREEPVVNVLMGSSYTAFLDINDPKYTNIGMQGYDASYGARLLGYREDLSPKYVFIELNTLYTHKKEGSLGDFLEGLNSPFTLFCLKFLPAIRDQNQPISFVGSVLFSKLSHYLPKGKEKKINLVNSDSKKIDLEFFVSRTKEIIAWKKKLKQQFPNAQQVFYEVPQGLNYNHTKARYEMLKQIQSTFPDALLIPLPKNAEEYKATDGRHLDHDAGIEYFNLFKKHVNEQRFIKCQDYKANS